MSNKSWPGNVNSNVCGQFFSIYVKLLQSLWKFITLRLHLYEINVSKCKNTTIIWSSVRVPWIITSPINLPLLMAEHKMLIPNGANISWQEATLNKKFDKVRWWHFFNQHKRSRKRAVLKLNIEHKELWIWLFRKSSGKKMSEAKSIMSSRVMSFEETFLYVECSGKF